jgi:hypothetical protein
VLCGLNRRNAKGLPCAAVGEPDDLGALDDLLAPDNLGVPDA